MSQAADVLRKHVNVLAEVDKINEISPNTLHSYRQKAAVDVKSKISQYPRGRVPDEVRFGPHGNTGTIGRSRNMNLAAQKLRAKGEEPMATTQPIKTAESLTKDYRKFLESALPKAKEFHIKEDPSNGGWEVHHDRMGYLGSYDTLAAARRVVREHLGKI